MSGLHLFAKLGGGTNEEVHNPSKHLKRKSHLYYVEDKAKFVTVTNSGGSTHKIFYEIHGNGPKAVVLVMGLAANHTQFEPQYYEFGKRLGAEYSVLIMDNRGVGFSDTPFHRWRTTDFASDIVQLLTQIEKSNDPQEGKKWHQNVNLVGFSMGGMIALETLLMDPGRFSTLTLISTHAGGIRGTLPPVYGFKPFLATFGALGGVSALCAGINLLYPSHILDQELSDADYKRYYGESEPEYKIRTYREHYGTAMIKRARKYVESHNFPEIRLSGVLLQVGAVISHYISWSRLRSIKNWNIPVLVINGAYDNLVDPVNSRMMAKATNAEHLYFKEAGHGVNEQYEHECNNALQTHFNKSVTMQSTRTLNRKPHAPEMLHPWKLIGGYVIIATVMHRLRMLKRLNSKIVTGLHTLFLGFILRKIYGRFTGL